MTEPTTRQGDTAKGLEDAPERPSVIDLRHQQQDEMAHAGLGTQGQWHGALFGVLVGGATGFVLMLIVAFALFGDIDAAQVLLPAIGACFGAVAGAVYQGGRNPEREQELITPDHEPDASAAVASNPTQANEH